jgi:putative tricarboxylic transport membrane protein
LIANGDPMVFITRPIAGPITIVAIILILLPLFKLARDMLRKRKGTPSS